ncbi:MAG: VWA domain-containing protein [Roseobacter sp.]
MSDVTLTLLRPWWLVGLLILIPIGWWLHGRRGGLGDWQKAVDPVLMQAMLALGRVDSNANRAPLWAMLATVTITLFALAGPAVERREAVSFRNLDGVLFVIDTSPSVTEDPRWPQMLTMGRFGISALGTRPGGLIIFAGDAYVATDMTLDHTQLGQTLSLLSAETVPDPGSRPARGLSLAADMLAGAEIIAGDVVLFTDGTGLGSETLRLAEQITQTGARLSLVALNSVDAAFETHAAVGKGAVFTLAQTDALSDWLAHSTRTRLEAQDFPLLFWKDLGRYVLLLALLPLLLLFRRQDV